MRKQKERPCQAQATRHFFLIETMHIRICQSVQMSGEDEDGEREDSEQEQEHVDPPLTLRERPLCSTF
jgi:hypothetical protein